mgnify:FL=1
MGATADKYSLMIGIHASNLAGPIVGRLTQDLSKIGIVGATAAAKLLAFKPVTSLISGLASQVLSLRTLFTGLIGREILETFTSFETGMAKVHTLIDETGFSIEAFGDKVLELGEKAGRPLNELTAGLRDVVSSGISTADALKFLDVSSKLALGGVTDVDTAVRGLVSITRAYNREADDAIEVSDSFFQAMKFGIGEVGEFVHAMGRVIPIAASAGLTIDEMNAAVAALTISGLNVNEAVTAFRQMLVSLLDPTKEAKKVAKNLGVEYSATALRAKGLVGWLEHLWSVTGNNSDAMARLFGNVRAMVGAMGLTAHGVNNLKFVMEGMADKTGATEQAFKKLTQTLNYDLQTLRNVWSKVVIEFSTAARPLIHGAIEGLTNALKTLTGHKVQLKAFFVSLTESFRVLFAEIKRSLISGEISFILSQQLIFIGKIILAWVSSMIPPIVEASVRLGKSFVAGILLGFHEAIIAIRNTVFSEIFDLIPGIDEKTKEFWKGAGQALTGVSDEMFKEKLFKAMTLGPSEWKRLEREFEKGIDNFKNLVGEAWTGFVASLPAKAGESFKEIGRIWNEMFPFQVWLGNVKATGNAFVELFHKIKSEAEKAKKRKGTALPPPFDLESLEEINSSKDNIIQVYHQMLDDIQLMQKQGLDRQILEIQLSANKEIREVAEKIEGEEWLEATYYDWLIAKNKEVLEKIAELKKKELKGFEKAMQEFIQQDIPNILSDQFTDAIISIVDGSKKASEAMKTAK